jgi:hypothetical protein
LGRYLATEGLMGEPPDWYALIQAAKYLGVAPWELMDQSIFWTDKALIAMSAEHSAQKQIEERHRSRGN